jgi:hypothetical protein
MDINHYMTEIVEPTIKEFAANQTSRRHAFLACVVTFHSIDYLTYPKKPRSRRASFGKKSPEFATVDRVAHAFKHGKTGHERNADFQPLKVEDVIEPPPAVWNLMFPNFWPRGVTLKNERDRDLLNTVKVATDFIRAHIKA